jgi:predicted small integral membrane protein
MLTTRLVKTAMVASTALFSLLDAYNNVVDYGSNYEFVRHTLSMDTTFPGNTLKGRAITSPTRGSRLPADHPGRGSGIGAILAFAVFASRFALRGLRLRTSPRAKQYAVIGVGPSAFCCGSLAFAVVGGEWFDMWQSRDWNGVPSAFRFYVTLLAVAIFLMQPDEELARGPCLQAPAAGLDGMTHLYWSLMLPAWMISPNILASTAMRARKSAGFR